MSTDVEEVEEKVFLCPTCKSKGFTPSVILGQCEFCDGTFNGDGPDKEINHNHHNNKENNYGL